MAIDRASFAGISFFLTSFEVRESYRHEILEFITDHPPEPRLYKKAPREFPVKGFLLGDESILARDLFLKVVATPKPQIAFLPSLGFFKAYCVSLTLSESEEGLEIELLLKEVPEVPNLANSLLTAANSLNDLVDTYALQVLEQLQVLSATSYGLRRLTDTVCKVHALLTSVNGLGLFSEPFQSASELLQNLENLSRVPKTLLKSILTSFDSLTQTQLGRATGGAFLGVLDGIVKLNGLPKLSSQIRREVFTELLDSLPTEMSVKLLKLEATLFAGGEPQRHWTPSPHKLSLLCAAQVGNLGWEAEIIARNQNVFACRESLR